MKKDGHTDVASSRRMCMTIIEDANDILDALPSDMEASVEDISILDADISSNLVDILTSVPSNFAKLDAPSPT